MPSRNKQQDALKDLYARHLEAINEASRASRKAGKDVKKIMARDRMRGLDAVLKPPEGLIEALLERDRQ